MNQLELILPFGIPPLAFAPDISRQLQAPALATLLGRADSRSIQHFDDFSRTLPHEILLAGHFPLESRMLPQDSIRNFANNSPSSAHTSMQKAGMGTPEGVWFHLTPVHIHIARDHLVLTDTRQIAIDTQEASQLFDIAEKVCAEYGKQLLRSAAGNWFLRADDWNDMQTATPDAACGHNIDIWMPKGNMARPWRQLQNEIQMHWHTLPLNQEREQRGQKIVNSVWLWGGSDAVIEALPAQADLRDFSQLDWQTAQHRHVVLDQLTQSALSSDWGSWLTHLQQAEQNWFAPALAALKSGQIQQLRLSFSDTRTLASFKLNAWSLKKFWRKPALQPLLSCARHDTH